MPYNANTLNLMEGEIQEMADANAIEYHRTHWIDNITPLSAANLNNLESGVETLYTLFDEQGYLTMRERTLNFTNFEYAYTYYSGSSIEHFPDSSHMTRGQYCFDHCSYLEELPENLDVSLLSHANYFCRSCTRLSIDSVPKTYPMLTHGISMFSGCNAFTGDATFNLPKLKEASSMFSSTNIENITLIFDRISQKDSLFGIFSNCSNLESATFQNMYVNQMVEVVDVQQAFYKCKNLVSISGFDLSGISYNELMGSNVFAYCNKLENISGIGNIKVNIDVGDSPLLTHESLMNIINGLMSVTAVRKLTISTESDAILTTQEKNIALNKGWTIIVREAKYA